MTRNEQRQGVESLDCSGCDNLLNTLFQKAGGLPEQQERDVREALQRRSMRRTARLACAGSGVCMMPIHIEGWAPSMIAAAEEKLSAELSADQDEIIAEVSVEVQRAQGQIVAAEIREAAS